jgi:hypothetical protein
MQILISPPEETDWSTSPDELAAKILAEWPAAELERSQDPDDLRALTWWFERDGRRLDGALANDGVTIHLDGDVRDAAAFARWFRKQVPAEQPLVFYDEGYSADVALTPDTDESELVTPFTG